MPDDWLMISACMGVASLLPVLLRLRAGLRGTALAHAWPAMFLAWTVWTVVSIVALVPSSLRSWAGCLWYLAAVVALIPPVAALGARRPINRAWTWFVLVPLVLVFAWPVMPAVWRGMNNPAAFDLETPVVVGFLLVSLMGAGNYLGLAHTVSALLWIAGLWLVVLPLCPSTSRWAADAPTGRALGTLCLVAAGWIADRQAARRCASNDGRAGLDRAWDDFRELFGIVWARRIMERFNSDAQRQPTPLHLALHGLEDASGCRPDSQADAASIEAAETSLRWLLQKFVDPEWIDRRTRRQVP
ncbi:MAG: hypothetical protein HY290_06205 [Planctomycetia bacterium]|nr:hypothetical protein [Planctomycetia bacterium]